MQANNEHENPGREAREQNDAHDSKAASEAGKERDAEGRFLPVDEEAHESQPYEEGQSERTDPGEPHRAASERNESGR